jgi:hypothetical protein
LPSPDSSANELARKVIMNEANAEASDKSHWMFRLETVKSGEKEVKEVVETKTADLDHLLSINGRPLTEKELRKEDQRLQELIKNPDQLRESQKEKMEDFSHSQRLLTMLPEAFTYSYGEHRGDLVKLNFTPNPSFRPPSREARVFHAMEGEILVDERQQRLAEISGHLTHDVKFGGGLLGHLDMGGEFHVKQAEVVPGCWELIVLRIDMKGKALFFKSITVQQHDLRSEFHKVPDDLTLAQAADILRREAISNH